MSDNITEIIIIIVIFSIMIAFIRELYKEYIKNPNKKQHNNINKDLPWNLKQNDEIFIERKFDRINSKSNTQILGYYYDDDPAEELWVTKGEAYERNTYTYTPKKHDTSILDRKNDKNCDVCKHFDCCGNKNYIRCPGNYFAGEHTFELMKVGDIRNVHI